MTRPPDPADRDRDVPSGGEHPGRPAAPDDLSVRLRPPRVVRGPAAQRPAAPTGSDQPASSIEPEPSEGESRTSRAGRDLPAAIAVGVGLGAVTIASLYAPPRWPFVILVVLAILGGTWELVSALRTLGARPTLIPLAAGGAAMAITAYNVGEEGLFLALAVTLVGCLVWRLADPAEGYLRDVAASALVAAYVPFLAGFAALMAVPADGPRRVTIFVVLVVCNDVGGYAVGSLIGRHPMAPSTSPKKSWEGLGGSLLFAAVAGGVLMSTLLHESWLVGVVLGVAIVASATLGDLGESMIKRDLGMKDFGSILPGHGGVMDRLDSLLPSAPVAWLLFAAFLT